MASHLIRRRTTDVIAALPVGGVVGAGLGGDAAEGEQVLGLRPALDVQGVVVGDDADEPVVGIDDRDGDQVVAADLVDDLLLVLVDAGEDRLVLHDPFDAGHRGGQDQPLQGDLADQLVVGADDVAGVDRLAVGGLAAEAVQGVAGGQLGGERGVIGGHDGAGGPRLVAGQAADVLALGVGQLAEDRLDELRHRAGGRGWPGRRGP